MSLINEIAPTEDVEEWDVAEWLRLWMQVHGSCNSFSKHHEFLKNTGVLILSGCEELINSNLGQGGVS